MNFSNSRNIADRKLNINTTNQPVQSTNQLINLSMFSFITDTMITGDNKNNGMFLILSVISTSQQIISIVMIRYTIKICIGNINLSV